MQNRTFNVMQNRQSKIGSADSPEAQNAIVSAFLEESVNTVFHTEIAIIGAGMTGLTCARVLQQAGYPVVVLEKSRGVGGRMATRRIQDAIADHGTCYLAPQGEQFRQLLQNFISQDIVQIWTEAIYTLDATGQLHPPDASDRAPRYIAPAGMTAIPKSLALGLDIRLNHRVINLALNSDNLWHLTLEASQPDGTASSVFTAAAVILAIPAPQAVMLLQPLAGKELSVAALKPLEAVNFAPCISVMAGYPLEREADWMEQYPGVKAIASCHHSNLAWIGVDSSKRPSSSHLVLVVQSTADFARAALDEIDLHPVGQALLQQVAILAPWIATPEWMQVHRWRYAFATHPLSESFWSAETPAPLVCTGDWCGGQRVEDALQAALDTADWVIKSGLT
jgi:renalase